MIDKTKLAQALDKDKLILFLLAVIALVAIGFVLKLAKPVILPLVIAWLLTFIFGPVISALTRKKVPLPLAILLVMLLLCGFVFAGFFFLQSSLSGIVAAFPKYEARFARLIGELTVLVPLQYNPLTDFDWAATVRDMMVVLSGSLLSILSNLVLVMIFLVFLLSGKPYAKLKMRHALSERRADQLNRIVSAISGQISRYLSVLVLISFATGCLVCLALFLIGVDFALTWGVLAFVLNFIPTLGSIVATALPIALALVQYYPSFWPSVIALIAVTAIQMTIGNFIAPKVLGDRLHLSPVVILVSLLFWGWLWGIAGALLAVPIASAIKIACENIDELQPISVMMGSGRRLWKDDHHSES